jgi:S1/P1 Nuclease
MILGSYNPKNDVSSLWSWTTIFRLAVLIGAVQFLLVVSASAWNVTGHVAIAELAWRQLTPRQQSKATAILKTHPHYVEYLAAGKPDGIEVDEWAFWRASYWPDWVRSHHSAEFNKPTWHYISAGFVPPYSKLDSAKLDSPPPNVVTQITASIKKLRNGTESEKPIYLCWLLHLVGDIHQPLHNCSLLSETFPEGDRGGNLSLVRIEGSRPVQLHKLFDNLLANETTPSGIGNAIIAIDQAEHDNQEAIGHELWEHTTPVEWTKESFKLAVKYAYLDGALLPANADTKVSEADVPGVAEVYVRNAKQMARIQMAKAGRRLATAVADGLNGRE